MSTYKSTANVWNIFYLYYNKKTTSGFNIGIGIVVLEALKAIVVVVVICLYESQRTIESCHWKCLFIFFFLVFAHYQPDCRTDVKWRPLSANPYTGSHVHSTFTGSPVHSVTQVSPTMQADHSRFQRYLCPKWNKGSQLVQPQKTRILPTAWLDPVTFSVQW